MNDETLTFPAGVLYGMPFTSMQDGIEWLNWASHVPYPTHGNDGLDYWRDPAELVPILAIDVPDLDLDSDPDDPTALKEIWKDYEKSRYGHRVTPLDLYPYGGTDRHFLEHAHAHWRELTGIGDLMRRQIPHAKSRRDLARDLGKVERALERIEEEITNQINGTVTYFWKHAILAGYPTDPANPYAPAADRLQVNPAGIPRLA